MSVKPDFEQLVRSRYGTVSPVIPDMCSNVIEQLLSHRSVRSYLPKPVSDEQLSVMLAAAQSAASSSNLQVWSVVAVRDPVRRAQLAECADNQAHVREAPLQLIWLADLSRLARIAGTLGRSAEGLDYLEMFLVGAIDAALAAQNAVIAAESLGLSTVYIGAMRNQPDKVAELLALPDKIFAVFGMCVGYADPAIPADIKPRLSQTAILHNETYSTEAEQDAVETYNTVMEQFYQQQKMKVRGTWAIHSAKRVAGADSLSGRDRLVAMLHKRGFGLK